MYNQNQFTSLAEKVKELGGHFLIYGIGSALQGFVTFLLLPMLSNYYTIEDYGKYTLIVLTGTLLGSFFYLGGQTAITRFYYDQNNSNYKSSVITNTTTIMLFGFILCILIGTSLSSFISNIIFEDTSYWKLISISAIAAAFGILNTYLITYLRIIKKSYLFIIVNILNLLVNFSSTYYFLNYSIFENSLLAPFYGQLLGLLVSVLLSAKHVVKMFSFSHIDYSKIKLYLIFSFPIVMQGFMFYIFDLSDRFVIENSLTFSEVGTYSFGYKIGTIVNLMYVVPFGLIFGVLRMEYAKDQSSNIFFSKIISYYTMVGILIVTILVIFTKNIITLAASSPDYHSAYIVTPWILVGQLILGYAGIVDFGIYYFKKTYYYFIIYGIVLTLNISLNLLLVEKLGFIFAAINKVGSYTILIIILFVISRRFFKIELEKRMYKLIISAIIILLLLQYISINSYSFLYTILLMISLVLFWYIYILDIKEKESLVKLKSHLISTLTKS